MNQFVIPRRYVLLPELTIINSQCIHLSRIHLIYLVLLLHRMPMIGRV